MLTCICNSKSTCRSYADVLHIERLLYFQRCRFSVLELDARYEWRVAPPNTHRSLYPINHCCLYIVDSAKAFNVRDVTYVTCNCLLIGKGEGQSFEMVVSCCAYGCVNCHGNRKGLGFFRFPVLPEGRRRQWIAAVKRKDWKPTKHTRICEEHFTTCKE